METKEKEQIRENNVYVLDLYRKGAELSKTTQEQSWFPPRGKFDREKGRMVATVQNMESEPMTKEMLEESLEKLRQETFNPTKKPTKPFLRLVKNED
jgi:hypothetical protein